MISIRSFQFFSMILVGISVFLPQVRAEDDPTLEVGAGVSYVQDQQIEALFRVSYDGATVDGGDAFFLRVRATATMRSVDRFDSLDIDVIGVGMQSQTDEYTAIAGLGSLNLTRDLSIGNGQMLRIALIGLRGELRTGNPRDTQFFVAGALDLLGIGIMKRVTDQESTNGIGNGARLEAGMLVNQRVRIAVGASYDRIDSNPQEYIIPGYYQCQNGYTQHNYGNGYYTCQNAVGTDYRLVTQRAEIYTDLVIDLSERLSIFGRASYILQDVTNEDAPEMNSNEHDWRLRVGIQVGI